METVVDVCGVGLDSEPAKLEYDAAKGGNKRRPFSPVLRHEDTVLPIHKRRTVSGGVRGLRRNLSILDWAIRRHLDYTTQFHLQSQSGNDAFDELFEQWFHGVSQPESFDVRGRFGFDEYLRTLEACAVIDGDCGSMKLASGHVQAIESDLIKNPADGVYRGRWINGVRVSNSGRHLAYAIHNRGAGGNGYEFNRIVTNSRLFLHGYYSRFDQIRGISPLVSAVNDFQDIYEGKELAFAKMKVNQLFALAFYRDADESAGDLSSQGDDEEPSGYDVNFGAGPALLDMEPGDRAEFLESDSPGVNTQEFLQLVIQIALKALDIPFSFFNESFTNFFGSKSAWLHYERSCVNKRARNLRWAYDWMLWRFRLALIRGEITAPASIIREAYQGRKLWFEFVPVGMPWWDPSKEIKADIMAIQAGLNSPQRVCRQHGIDFYEIQKQRKKAFEYSEKLGVPIVLEGNSPDVTSDDPEGRE
ncbi:phage portal protein [Thalassoglobus polymorphus]|uniref:Phage portal protein, lambda family n=1 Tax=Thalassoglobus polymorphus TaxID=2527994 RepID=A0A517QH17_9PLAN|nr:phage portal protein [Thalassoglobus polymorphus]QDT30929.1 Phage portal protein, lambda family [Thalassoglobus polymorphus]QDT30974.1 Phage portal protein, lambda family [Thalassoglobus polymorphus]